MGEERKRVLNMLAAGKITVEDAEQLLNALNQQTTQATTTTATAMKSAPKYLHVTVDAPNKLQGGEAEKVNVRIPLQLMRAGMKFASLIPQSAQGQVNQALHDKGIQFNLTDMTPEMVDELITSLSELTVEVDDSDGSHVRVFCE